MRDEEIRYLQHRAETGDLSAYSLLAVAFERDGDLVAACKNLKEYFNLICKPPYPGEELCVVLNNYFRLLLQYCNSQNKCNLPIEDLITLGRVAMTIRPFQFVRIYNSNAMLKEN